MTKRKPIKSERVDILIDALDSIACHDLSIKDLKKILIDGGDFVRTLKIVLKDIEIARDALKEFEND